MKIPFQMPVIFITRVFFKSIKFQVVRMCMYIILSRGHIVKTKRASLYQTQTILQTRNFKVNSTWRSSGLSL